MNRSESLIRALMEDDTAPDRREPARTSSRRAPTEKVDKWKKASASYMELEKLYAKRNELEKEIGFTVRWNHALAEVGYEPEEAKGVMLASDVSAFDNLPSGHVARPIFRSYSAKYPRAVIGAHLKSGGVVFFDTPVWRVNPESAPSYEEFRQRRREAADRQ